MQIFFFYIIIQYIFCILFLKMEYIIYNNEIRNSPLNMSNRAFLPYGYAQKKNTGAMCCVVILLIIIVIIILLYLFFGGNINNSGNQYYLKNGFKASPEAQKDYQTISNILKEDPNPSYSKVKLAVGENMDIAKYSNIIGKKNLTADDFDNY